MTAVTALAWRRPALRTAFFGLACLMLAGLVVQLYLAGMMALHDYAAYQPAHVALGNVLELTPLLLSLFAFLGKGPVRLVWQPLLVVLLVGLQHATVNVPVDALRGLHAVNALAIVGVTAWLAHATRPHQWLAGGRQAQA